MNTLLTLWGAVTLVMVFTFVYYILEKSPLDYTPRNDCKLSNRLSSEQIKHICETDDGYFWISTESGLNRYDGTRYLQFRANNDSTSLINNNVTWVEESHFHPGHLLVSTFNGTCIYYPEGYFLPVQQGYSFLKELNEHILITRSFTQVSIWKTDEQFRPKAECCNLKFGSTIRKVIPRDSTSFWVFTARQAMLYNTTLHLLQSINFEEVISSVLPINDKKAWIVFSAHATEIDLQKGIVSQTPQTTFTNTHADIQQLTRYAFSHGKLSLSGNQMGRTQLVDIETMQLQEVTFDQLMSSEYGYIYEDSKGNLWAGSRGFGIQTILRNHELFANHDNLCTYFDKKDITLLHPGHGGKLWVITGRNRIYCCHLDGRITAIDSSQFSTSLIFHLVETRDGRLFIVTSGAVVEAEISGVQLKEKARYPFINCYAIMEDEMEQLWIGSSEGAYVLNKQTHLFEQRVTDARPISVIRQLRDGRLAMGSFEQGIVIYDPKSYKQTHYQLPPVKPGIYSCRDLAEGCDGQLWIASLGMGIYKLDLNTGAVENFQSPLMNSDVTCILAEPDQPVVWMGTLGGLTRFDARSSQCYTFDETDGVKGNEFFEKCAVRVSDSTMLFGGKKGITAFNPHQIHPEVSKHLGISSLIVNQNHILIGKSELTPDGMDNGASIHLPYQHASLEINLSTLDFASNTKAVILYNLSKDNGRWLYAQDQRIICSRLAPGKHELKIKSVNSSGETVAALKLYIKVDYPWWNKWWLRWICWPLWFLLLFLTVGRIVRDTYMRRLRLRQALRDKMTQEYINDMNMKFFTNISHEFRTPLTLIKGAIELLKSGYEVGDSHPFRIISSNTHRMLRLVNQLLDFNKLEHDMLRLKVQYQPIFPLVAQIAEMFSSGFTEKNIHFAMRCKDDDLQLWIDSDKYEKVTVNLLSNAMKYTPRGGMVSLEVNMLTPEIAKEWFSDFPKAQTGQWLLTQVRDNGIGIPKDQLGSIFERFNQLHRAGYKANGTGIGLCYSRGLVRLHHGTITVQQVEQGTGSIFAFILPIEDSYSKEEKIDLQFEGNSILNKMEGAQEDHSPLPPPNAGKEDKERERQEREPDEIETDTTVPLVEENTPESADQSEAESAEHSSSEEVPTLLVVDDDSDMRHYLKQLLGKSYRVVTESSATDALELLPSVKPHLIVSDVMMLGIDGYKFCNLIKSNPSYCHIPVILLTAKSSIEDHIGGLNVGADAYVTKPFEPTYLLALIRSTLLNRTKMQKLLNRSTSLDTNTSHNTLISQPDSIFMEKLYGYMQQHLSEAELSMNDLLEQMGMSRSKFYYKMKELTGQTPNAFFKIFKLNKAAEMILAGEEKISYIAEITGFCGNSHFATHFKRQFGVLPSEYKAAQTADTTKNEQKEK